MKCHHLFTFLLAVFTNLHGQGHLSGRQELAALSFGLLSSQLQRAIFMVLAGLLWYNWLLFLGVVVYLILSSFETGLVQESSNIKQGTCTVAWFDDLRSRQEST